MAFRKVTDWSEAIYNAGALGFNLLRDFEPELHRVYPETRPYTFGYFSEDDITNVSTIGWTHMKGDDIEVDDWNSKVGLRFGLTVDASNNVKHGSNYIMYMPRQHRENVILPARKKAIEEQERRADDAGKFVHPSDPEYNRMKDRLEEVVQPTEKVKVQVRGEPDHGEPQPEKKPRGRPKKAS